MLSSHPQAEQVAGSAGSRCRALAALMAGQALGWNRDSLRPIYLNLVRSVLDYCAVGWQPWLARTSMEVVGIEGKKT